MGRMWQRWAQLDPGWGVAAVRVIMAIVIIVTGYQKLTAGVDRVTAIMVHDGIPLPTVAGIFITGLEVLGGLLLLVGLGGRLLGLLYLGEFLVVTFHVQLPTEGLMAARLPIMLLAGALMLAIAGSGKLSVDDVLERRHAGAASGPRGHAPPSPRSEAIGST
jgi:putative oxidoreductase